MLAATAKSKLRAEETHPECCIEDLGRRPSRRLEVLPGGETGQSRRSEENEGRDKSDEDDGHDAMAVEHAGPI